MIMLTTKYQNICQVGLFRDIFVTNVDTSSPSD